MNSKSPNDSNFGFLEKIDDSDKVSTTVENSQYDQKENIDFQKNS